jgi:hypothetical protein
VKNKKSDQYAKVGKIVKKLDEIIRNQDNASTKNTVKILNLSKA